MAFRMDPNQAMETEARRIADKQLQLAIAGLGAADGADGDRRIHTARRHVKKLRALIHLVEPRVEQERRHGQRRLRRASRLLAPVADSEALVRTLDALCCRYPDALPPAVQTELRAVLGRREREVRRRVDFRRLRLKVAGQLAAEQVRVRTWQLGGAGVDAVAAGVRRSVRRGRRSMRRALARPTTRRYSTWRRRVKELWFQLRLIEGCTGGRLIEDQRRLEQLDGVLGEAHNCALLCDALVAGALHSRADTAHCLRIVRRYRADLRREARAVAPLVHGVPPRAYSARVARCWHTATVAGSPPGTVTWHPAA